MNYLCLAYEEERTLDALSREAWDGLRMETLDYVEELSRSGRLVLAHALQSVRSATTARDLNEAIQVASRRPSARLGSIEVRPIEEALRLESRYGGGA